MSAEIPINVETIEMQKNAVRASDNLDNYLRFTSRHFANSLWPQEVSQWVELQKFDPEFFRLLGLIGIICAQYGYPSIDGQSVRHEARGWKRSPVNPRHQLALGVNTAAINLQAIPVKEELAEKLKETPEFQFGVWGFFFRAEKGKLLPIDPKYTDYTAREAEYRLANRRMIALPDRDLNIRLADIKFSGDDAERMSDSEFETQVLPQVVDATKEWINPIPVFSPLI